MCHIDDKPIRAAAVVLALALLAVPQVAAAKPRPFHPAASKTFGATVMAGELIVAYKPGADAARRADVRRQEGASLKRRLLLADTELVKVAEGGEKAAAASFARRRDVAYAEPNAILRARATPNDMRFSELWGLHNGGQVVNGMRAPRTPTSTRRRREHRQGADGQRAGGRHRQRRRGGSRRSGGEHVRQPR